MKIIIIRHGDPDYANDTLTLKGIREAKLLAKRVSKWKVTDFYCSPLGRAEATASYSLAKMNRTAATCDWLREFYYPVTDPITGKHGVPWDFVSSYWTGQPLFYDREHWFDAPLFQSNPEIKQNYLEVCASLDELLSRYGYFREGNFYRIPAKEEVFIKETAAPGSTAEVFASAKEEDVIVLFCHLGVASVLLSHLLGIAFPLIPHSFFLAPTSVTVLGSEERWSNEAFFRIQVAGDTTHLHDGGEPISCAGAFYGVFQETSRLFISY